MTAQLLHPTPPPPSAGRAGEVPNERVRSSMPASWQRALYIPLIVLAWLAIVLLGGWLLTHVAKTLLTLLLSGITAFALTPLVSLLARWLPRRLAIAVAYVLGFVLVFGVGALLVGTAATQITTLVGNLPKYAHQLRQFEPQLVTILQPFGVTLAKLHAAEQQAVTYLQGLGTTVAKDSLGVVSGIVGTLIDIVLILILSVYLTANGPKIAQRLRHETPGTQRWRMSLLIATVNQVVGGYIRGTLTLATLIGVLVSRAFCVLIALFQGWVLALLVLAYFVVVHIIEGDVVGPRIMGKAVGIHPATALVALVAGIELFGFWGALLAAPLAGLLQAIGTAVWRELRGGDAPVVVQAVREEEKRKGEEKERAQEEQ